MTIERARPTGAIRQSHRPRPLDRSRLRQAAQRLGFAIAESQEMFDLSAHRRATGELRARAKAKGVEIDARIAQLEAMRADLTAVLAAQCDSLTDCSCRLGCPLPFVELNDVQD